ncbi:Uncharacterised protein [Streptococcus pneumoniae]|nr:Uncharacterised protein [Streptococcus pneumoniae]
MQIKFIDKVSNLIMLNLLYVASVVTVIAIGSGESALIATLIKIVRHEESYPYRDFANSFFKDYWKNLGAALISNLPILILLFSFFFLPYIPLPIYIISILRHIGVIYIILHLMATTFLIPLIGRYNNTLKNSLHNLIMLAYKHFFIAVLIRIIEIIPVLLFFILQNQLLVWITLMIFILPSITKYANAFLYNFIFSKYEKLN